MNRKKMAPSLTYLCYICGKEINDELHVYIRTRRRTELHIYYGCMRPEGRRSRQ